MFCFDLVALIALGYALMGVVVFLMYLVLS